MTDWAAKASRHVALFMLENPAEVVPLGSRLADCELACSLVNLGIAEHLAEANVIRLRSASRARQFLGLPQVY